MRDGAKAMCACVSFLKAKSEDSDDEVVFWASALAALRGFMSASIGVDATADVFAHDARLAKDHEGEIRAMESADRH